MPPDFSPGNTELLFDALKAEEQRRRRRVPSERRRRVDRACLNCRNRKVRCDGLHPCKSCMTGNLQCTYPAKEESPFESAKEYFVDMSNRHLCFQYIVQRLCYDKLPVLDTTTLMSMCSIMKTKELVTPSDVIDIVAQLKNTGVPTDASRLHIEPPVASVTPVVSVPPVASVTIDNTEQNVDEIADLIGRIKVDPNGESRYIGASAGEAFMDSVQREFLVDPSIEDLDAYSNSHRTLQPSDHDLLALQEAWKLLPPPEVSDFLIKSFYTNVQANFFFFHEKLLRYRLGLMIHHRAPVDPGFLCLAMMIFALGSQFAHMEIRSARSPIDNPGKQFFDAARMLFPQVMQQCKPSLVQASMLMGLYLQPSLSQKSSYSHFGLSLSAAVANGLHRSYENPNIDSKTRELRNRLWWSVYTIDRLISIATGRPLSITDSECDADLPTVVPELEVEGSASNVHNIISMTKIARIMGKTMEQLYGGVNYRKNPIKIIESLRADLENWKNELPTFQVLENLDPSDPLFRANIHLHMTYDQAIIVMSRPFLLHKMKNSKTSPAVNRIYDDCIIAARHLIFLVRQLQLHSKLSCYSFFDYNYTFSSALVVLLHRVTEPCEEDDIAMEHAYSALDYMAEGNEPARNCARIIRLFDAHLKGKRGAGKVNPSESGFMAWQKWVAEVSNKEGSKMSSFNNVMTPIVGLPPSGSVTPALSGTCDPTDFFNTSQPALSRTELDPFGSAFGLESTHPSPDLITDSSLINWANSDQGMDIEGSWMGNIHPSWLDYVCP
ncbi:transcription factor [Schizosaccharomyces japonicus yFS275]|uniref:Transcription factor n=1 Tax=Schizosaccharomyces japonicus (strain yFS275 / FY16936) TaxID=402676 RepID=B6K0Z1_SCHJY|nr:transcription factor [Schizosaccharomyces japonicus yFS275]EEB07612.1 transcription factor [Schizosaccharomyces japonicus yFS275]